MALALRARACSCGRRRSNSPNFAPEWTILHACDFHADPARDGTKSEACVAISFEQKLVVACGTHYAGEIKKAVFTVLNYLLPAEGRASRCTAPRTSGQSGDVALFFGLSGTGKTTLSADPERRLIGDDEHGWGERRRVQHRGRLLREDDPALGRGRAADLERAAVRVRAGERAGRSAHAQARLRQPARSRRTRAAAYPVDFIPNCELSGVGGHPKNVFFLTCDAFGVLPPLARLTPEQAVEYFLCGYTAKVAGTEAGVTEPTPEFSACFAKPFLPLPPKRYAAMLKEKLEQHGVPVWLVNTGWTGGPPGVGKRMKLAHTRALLKAALTGQLEGVPFAPDPVFGLAVPATCPGVPDGVLRPRDAWADKAAYDAKAKELAERFKAEFKKYA